MECLLTLNDINFNYGIDTILDSISLSINRGDRIAIVGSNGCGKSTLLSILSGYLKDYDGTRSIKKFVHYEVVEQYLPEEMQHHTLLESLLQKFPSEEKILKQFLAEKTLKDLYFEERDFQTLVKNLSGGGQNRLMFARAIIRDPDLVFMDEPTIWILKIFYILNNI